MTIDLYYAPPSAPCRAIQLTASALGIKLNLKLISILKKEQFTPEFLKLNPQHKVPTLVDNGFVLTESRAIMAYLADQYGKNDSLYPKDPKKRAVVNQRLYFDMGTLYQCYTDLCYPMVFGKAPYDEEKAKKLGEALGFLDGFLANSTYAAGDNITIADFTLVVTVSSIEVMDYDLSKYTNVTKWLKKCKETMKDYATTNQAGVEAFKQLAETLKGQ